MYQFEAHYINTDNNEKIARIIAIDCQLFLDEEEVYIYAMRKAYSMRKPEEYLVNLEYIFN